MAEPEQKNISTFERALSFAHQFKTGRFKNQNEMAKALGVSQSLISRMIKTAELIEHDWLRRLFRHELELKIKPLHKLLNMLKDDLKKNNIQEAAHTLEIRINSGERLSTKKILQTLLQAASVGTRKQEIKFCE